MKTKANNSGIPSNRQRLIGVALMFSLWLALPASSVHVFSASSDATPNHFANAGTGAQEPGCDALQSCRFSRLSPYLKGDGMEKVHLVYPIKAMPDVQSPRHLATADGDVLKAIFRGAQELLRQVVDSLSESVTATWRFLFNPVEDVAARQTRLHVSLNLKTADTTRARNLDVWMRRGPLSLYYEYGSADPPQEPPWSDLTCAVYVVRLETVVSPIHGCDVNPAIPDSYYVVKPFVARPLQAFTTVDRVLDTVDEPFVIDIAVTSTDTSADYRNLNGYSERLTAINRPPFDEWSREADEPQFIGKDRTSFRPQRLRTPHPPQKDTVADEVLHTLRDIVQTQFSQSLLFNVRLLAASAATAKLVASVFAEQVFDGGSFRVVPFAPDHPFTKVTRQAARDLDVVAVPTLESLFPRGVPPACQGLHRMSSLTTLDEFASAFSPPVAGHYSSPRTTTKDTDPIPRSDGTLIPVGYESDFFSNVSPEPDGGILRGIWLDVFNKHAFLGGAPGSGKTSLNWRLALELWRQGDIGVLMIFPIKYDHRAMVHLRYREEPEWRALGENMQFFAPGNDILPYRHNPFAGAGKSWYRHIGPLQRLFKAAMALGGPLESILTESLYRTYKEFELRDYPPTLDDCHDAAEAALYAKRYSPETVSDLRGALDARFIPLTIGPAGRIARCAQNVPDIPSLFHTFTVHEMNALDPQSFAINTTDLLEKIRAHAMTLPYRPDRPHIVIFIDEFHRLAPSGHGPAIASESSPDSLAHTGEFMARMVAETRGMGMSLIMSDQSFGAVHPEIVKNCGTIFSFKQTDPADIEVAAAAMGLGPLEQEDLPRLTPGYCYQMTEGYFKAARIKVIDTLSALHLENPPLEDAILQHVQDLSWYRENQEKRLRSELDLLHAHSKNLSAEIARISARAGILLHGIEGILKAKSGGRSIVTKVQRIAAEARRLSRQTQMSYERYRTRSLTPLTSTPLPPCAEPFWADERKYYEDWFKTTLSPLVLRTRRVLQRVVTLCEIWNEERNDV